MALSRSSQIEQKLNSYEVRNESTIWRKSSAALRCFEHALQINSAVTTLWIEYGSLAYVLHSHASRQLKQNTYFDGPRDLLKVKKDEMLLLAERCFREANKSVDGSPPEEAWLHHYMLGKIAQKQGKEPAVFLGHFQKSLMYLHEDKARYPHKIQYHNPPDLSIEVLEVFYRTHASCLKCLTKSEKRGLTRSGLKVFSDCLHNVASGPFMKFQEKHKTAESIASSSVHSESEQEASLGSITGVGLQARDTSDHNYFITCHPKKPVADASAPGQMTCSLELSSKDKPLDAAVDVVAYLLDTVHKEISFVKSITIEDFPASDVQSRSHIMLSHEIDSCGDIYMDENCTYISEATCEVKTEVISVPGQSDIQCNSDEPLDVLSASKDRPVVSGSALICCPLISDTSVTGVSESFQKSKSLDPAVFAISSDETDEKMEWNDSSFGSCDLNFIFDACAETLEFILNSLDSFVSPSCTEHVTYNGEKRDSEGHILQGSEDKCEILESLQMTEMKIQVAGETVVSSSDGVKELAEEVKDADIVNRDSQKSSCNSSEKPMSPQPPESADRGIVICNSSVAFIPVSLDLDVISVKELEESKEKIEALVTQCLNGLRECLKRFIQHYKSLYRLAYYYTHSTKNKNLQWAREILLAATPAVKNYPSMPGLFAERKNTNFFNGIWRAPSNEIDRPGTFGAHMYRSVRLLIDVLSQQNDYNMLLYLTQQLSRTPDLGKKYMRDAERMSLAREAYESCVTVLREQMNSLLQEEPPPEESRLTCCLLEIYRTYQALKKNSIYVDDTEEFLKEAYTMYKLGEVDPCPTVLEQAIKFCQLQLGKSYQLSRLV